MLTGITLLYIYSMLIGNNIIVHLFNVDWYNSIVHLFNVDWDNVIVHLFNVDWYNIMVYTLHLERGSRRAVIAVVKIRVIGRDVGIV